MFRLYDAMRHADVPAEINHLTARIRAAAFRVHSDLGPGLAERVYQMIWLDEMVADGLDVAAEVPISIIRRGRAFDVACRVDLVVNGTVAIEVKAVAELAPIHLSQLYTYMRLGGYPVGILANFNSRHLKEGYRRLVNAKATAAPAATEWNGRAEAATTATAPAAPAPLPPPPTPDTPPP